MTKAKCKAFRRGYREGRNSTIRSIEVLNPYTFGMDVQHLSARRIIKGTKWARGFVMGVDEAEARKGANYVMQEFDRIDDFSELKRFLRPIVERLS